MDIKFSGSDAGGFQFDPNAAPKPKRERKPRKSIGSKGGRIAVNTLVTLLVGAVFFYVQMPAINLHAEEFYGFVLLPCVTYCICALFTSGFQGTGAKGYFTFVKKQCTVPFIVMALMIVTALVGALTSWVVLRAKDYQALLPIDSGSFASEIEEVSYDRIPMLDRDSAEKLGDRKLGELADMVSREFPVLASLNPAKAICDMFYSLYYYDGLEVFAGNVALIGLFSAALFAVGALFVRRQRYASL